MAQRTMRTIWIGYLCVTLALFVVVEFDLDPPDIMDVWGTFGVCLLVLAGMPFVSRVVRAMTSRECLLLSARRLRRISFDLGGGILDYEDLAALTLERDKKSRYWIFRDAAKPRRKLRVRIEAYPEMDEHLQTIKDWMEERRP